MKQLLLPLLCLSLAACAVGPDYHEPAVQAPAAYGDWHGGSPALRETGLATGTAQSFARFDDPVLTSLQQQALAANHDVKSAALRFAQSRTARNIAAGAQAPQLTAHAGAVRQRQSESGVGTRMVDAIGPANREVLIEKLSDPFALYQAGFDASWELDLWGRVRRSVEAADAGMAEASSILRDVQLAVQLEVARNYYEVRAAQRQHELLQADLVAVRDMTALAATRERGGLATGLDVEQQRSSLAELEGRAPALLEQEAAATNRLTMLLARPPGALREQLAARQGAAVPGGPDLALGVPGEVMRHRPDIQAAEARLQAAMARTGVAVADLYPRITLGLSLGVESLDAGKFADWGSRQWSLGPSLQLPIFDNGRRRATVELRKLEEQEAAINFQKTVLEAWHEMDDALSAYAAARQRQQALAAREASARATLELAATRARRGMSDQLPMLQAQRALLAVQRERAASDSELALRLLAICKASGLPPQP